MGMNYYVKFKDRKVNQPDLHIGKKSIGWEFSFQGYEEDTYYNTPQLLSKKEWFEYLFLNSDLIYNEEDKQIEFLEFVKIVLDSKKNTDNKNHYDYCKNSNYDLSDLLLDEEGFSISLTDFS